MRGITGSKLLVKALKEENVEYIFGYPGGYATDIFDELYKQDHTQLILPRHEQGLIHAADGYARSTGKVGVCLVTSGPGATNLVTGISTATYDSVPLVCFTGQVPLHLMGNDAFQEVDIVGICRNICKYAVTVRNREDLGRIIKEAFYIASTGRPGPVLIDLPQNIMKEIGPSEYPDSVNIRSYKPNYSAHVGQLKKAIRMLEKAKRPLFMVGGGVHISGAEEAFGKLAATTGVPVVTTIMGKGVLDADDPLLVGCMGMHGCYAANKAVSECDLLFSIGTRFNDRITGKLYEFAPKAQIIHIDIDTASISRNVTVHVPIVADAKEAIDKLNEYVKPIECESWKERIAQWDKEYPLGMNVNNEITPQNILDGVNRNFDEGIIVTDVGQHQMWTTQFLKLSPRKKLLTSGGLGTMGFGLPAAIGAQFGNPDKPVICICGDGGFQMTEQELAVAVAWELPITICIMNNASLGMVRQMQKLFYGKRYSGTCLNMHKSCLGNCGACECPPYIPDFQKLAAAYDIPSVKVTSAAEIDEAFVKAKAETKRPFLIEFIIDKENLVLPMVRGGDALEDMILEC